MGAKKVQNYLSEKINIRTFFGIVFFILVVVLIYDIKESWGAVRLLLSAEEKKALIPDIIKESLPIAKDMLLFIVTGIGKWYVGRRDTKKELNKNMQNALHSDNLNLFGYVSFNDNPFSEIITASFPENCNISKGLVIQMLSDKQLFPVDYQINEIKVIAYYKNKRIRRTQCFYNNKQIVICFEEANIKRKNFLYEFITNTFYLKRIGSVSPTIDLKLNISYSYENVFSKYSCRFSAKPDSGIDINGQFKLE